MPFPKMLKFPCIVVKSSAKFLIQDFASECGFWRLWREHWKVRTGTFYMAFINECNMWKGKQWNKQITICKKTFKRLLNVLAAVSEFQTFDAISWRHVHFRLSLINHKMYVLFCLPLWQDMCILLPSCPIHQVKKLSPALKMVLKQEES